MSAAQQSVKAAIEMADAKLKATASNAAATGSAEILQKLAELEASGKDKSAEDANRGDALLARLEEMASYLEHMDGKMAEMRLEADERAQDQAKQLSLVHTKLDALLTGSHEQVFHYFILVPKPYKGYAGRAIDSLKPRNWFAKPMLLVPLYRDPKSGDLKRAPVNAQHQGFEVPKPLDFVRAHPRVVQVAMLVLKAGIQIGAAQLAVAIPAASLAALSTVTDALVSDTLQLAIEGMASNADDTLGVQEAVEEALDAEARKESIDAFMASEAATAPPADVLSRLATSHEYKAASRHEYGLLKQWLDTLHPGWDLRCGLEPNVNRETGSVEWRPVAKAITSRLGGSGE